MVFRRRKFDAKAYWANKPLCTVCQSHRVKTGTVCSECRKTRVKQDALVIKQKKAEENQVVIQSIVMKEADLNNTEEHNQETSSKNLVSKQAQDKIVRLFAYLEKALSLDDTIIRDFRSSMVSPSPWWLADYPRDLDNLSIRSFETDTETVATESSSWLKVQKKSIEQTPVLPEVLQEWVPDVNPIETPVAIEKIDRKILFDSDKNRVVDFKKFRKEFEQGDEVPESLDG